MYSQFNVKSYRKLNYRNEQTLSKIAYYKDARLALDPDSIEDVMTRNTGAKWARDEYPRLITFHWDAVDHFVGLRGYNYVPRRIAGFKAAFNY